MAYFDSPKNRALWEKELSTLRKMKEERQSGRVPAPTASREKTEMNMRNLHNMHRVRTSYKELLAEETAEVRAHKSAGRTKAVQKSAQKAAPSMTM